MSTKVLLTRLTKVLLTRLTMSRLDKEDHGANSRRVIALRARLGGARVRTRARAGSGSGSGSG